MRFSYGPVAEGEQAVELAFAHAMVTRARTEQIEEMLRVYRPTAPVVVFGRRETRLPGFAQAVRVARAAGFEPVVRATGGRAVAYTTSALVVDHVRHEPAAVRDLDYRFEGFGHLFVEVFRNLGVDARLGAVPGEYCPGAHSVNARGVVKLVGTAQRVVRNAWLFSSLIVVGDADRLQPVLAEVYGCLGQDLDVSSVGSVSGEVPGVGIDEVERAVIAAYEANGPMSPAPIDGVTLELARELLVDHRA